MSRQKQRPFATFNDSDSDSDDSDYCPGSLSPTEDEVQWKGKRKAAKAMIQPPAEKKTRASASDRKQLITNGSHILRQFPPEILVKVFQYAVQAEGITKLLPRISRVCRSWHEVSHHPLVWSVLDIPVQTLKLNMSKTNALMQNNLSCCKHLNVSGQSKLVEANIMTILKATPCLKSLNLSDCTHLKVTLLRKIPSLCPQLSKFSMCFTNDFFHHIGISGFEGFLADSGKNLLELRLSKVLCVQVSAKQVFAAVQAHCPKLQVLDLSIPDPAKKTAYPSKRFEFDAHTFFLDCPDIRELYLDGFNLVTPRALGPSTELFKVKNLEILSVGYHCHEQADKPVFYRLFGATPQLQYLDVSCSKLLPDLVTSQLRGVTELVMRDMKWRDSDHSQLYECIQAWKHSLVRLDLSYNTLVDSALDTGLMVYGSGDDHPLQTLDLKYTNVTATTIQTVLKHCAKLQEVDLTSCRDLPRGCKHLVYRAEFDFLEECLRRE